MYSVVNLMLNKCCPCFSARQSQKNQKQVVLTVALGSPLALEADYLIPCGSPLGVGEEANGQSHVLLCNPAAYCNANNFILSCPEGTFALHVPNASIEAN